MIKESSIPFKDGLKSRYVSLTYKNKKTAMILALPKNETEDVLECIDYDEVL